MAINYPGPEQIRVFYTVAGRKHQFALNFKSSLGYTSGALFSAIFPDTRDGGNAVALSTHVENLLTDIGAIINSAAGSFDLVEVWRFTPGTFDAQFMSSYTPTAQPTSASPTQNAGEIIYTFRTQEGGTMRFHLLDIITPPGLPLTPPLGATHDAIVAELAGDDQPWLARDTSFPLSLVGIYPGQNERWFKKIYRET